MNSTAEDFQKWVKDTVMLAALCGLGESTEVDAKAVTAHYQSVQAMIDGCSALAAIPIVLRACMRIAEGATP